MRNTLDSILNQFREYGKWLIEFHPWNCPDSRIAGSRDINHRSGREKEYSSMQFCQLKIAFFFNESQINIGRTIVRL